MKIRTKCNYTYFGIASLVVFMALFSPLQAQRGPGVPNVPQIKGKLLSGPLEEFAGRTAVITYHDGFIITHIESSGSAGGSSLVSSMYDVSDLSNIRRTPISFLSPGSFAGSHGFFQEGRGLNLKNDATMYFEDTDNNGIFDTLKSATSGPLRNTFSAPLGLSPFPGRGYLYQPFGITTWFYGDDGSQARFGLRNDQIGSNWNVRVRGLTTIMGNLAFYFGHSANSAPKGIEIFDLSPVLGAQPSGVPTLVSSVIGAESAKGYWPELWGGRDPATNKQLVRAFFNGDADFFSIWDMSDWANKATPREICKVDPKLPGGTQFFQYVSFQDEFAFSNGLKINMIDCSYELIADGFRERIGTNQWMMPLGNLVFVGGIGSWPRSEGGLAGGMSIWAHQANPDRRAPKVGFQIPLPNTTSYPVKAPLSHFIPETLDNLTLNNKTSFKVQKVSQSSCNAPLEGRLIFTSNQILMFTPDVQFDANSTYEVSFPDGQLKDAAGNSIAGFAYKFSTGGSVNTGRCTSEPLINADGSSAPSPTPTPTPLNPAPRIVSLSGILTSAITVNSTVTLGMTVEGGVAPLVYQWEINNQIVSPYSTQNRSITNSFSSIGTFPIKGFVRDALGRIDVIDSSVLVRSPSSSLQSTTKSAPVVLDSELKELWTTNIDDNSVSVINTSSLQKIAEIGVCKEPDSIAIAPNGSKWISCSGDDRLAQLNSSSDTNPTFIDLPYGSKPMGIVIQGDGNGIMYVAAEGLGAIYRVNLSSRVVTNTLSVGGTPHAIALNISTKRLFVTSFIASMDAGGTVWRIPVEEGSSFGTAEQLSLAPDTTSIPTSSSAPGIPNYLADIAINPDGGDVWVVGKKDNVRTTDSRSHDRMVRSLLSVFDPNLGERVHQRFDFDNSAPPRAVTFSKSGLFGAVALQGTNQVRVLSSINRKPVAGSTVSLAPRGLVLDENEGRIYSLSLTDPSVAVLDAKDLFTSGVGSLEQISVIKTVTKPVLDATVRLGKQVFYNAGDARMTKQETNAINTGYFACADCHFDGGHDGMSWNFTDRGEGIRNTTNLQGGRGDEGGMLHWTGNFDEVQDFEHDIRGAFGGLGFLTDSQFNSNNRNFPMGASKTGLNEDLDAMAAYLRSLREFPRSSVKSSATRYSDQARQGAKMLLALDCTSCHSGPLFTDSPTGLRHDVGTITSVSGKRLNQTLDGFDTPTLIGLLGSAPYFHDGSAASLDAVLSTRGLHDISGKVAKEHRDQIVAFLKELDTADTGFEQGGQPLLNAITIGIPKFDIDGDLMDDATELRIFGSLNRNGLDDFDGDGTSDRDEIEAGTDPKDPKSRPTITPVEPENTTCTYEYLAPSGEISIWNDGFNAALLISSNTGTDLGNNWKLSFDLPKGIKASSVKPVWSVAYSIKGSTVSASYTKTTDSTGVEWINGRNGHISTGFTVNKLSSLAAAQRLSSLPIRNVRLNGENCVPKGLTLRFKKTVSLDDGRVILGNMTLTNNTREAIKNWELQFPSVSKYKVSALPVGVSASALTKGVVIEKGKSFSFLIRMLNMPDALPELTFNGNSLVSVTSTIDDSGSKNRLVLNTSTNTITLLKPSSNTTDRCMLQIERVSPSSGRITRLFRGRYISKGTVEVAIKTKSKVTKAIRNAATRNSTVIGWDTCGNTAMRSEAFEVMVE